jgi:uncharacterized membrane protein
MNQASKTHLVAAQYTQFTTGPLPEAQQLVQYESILPGSADRILIMAENQARHRQEIEKLVIAANIRDSRAGTIFAFFISMSTIIAGTIVALNGYDWPGVALGGSGLAGLASVFIYGTRSNRKERESKSL